MYSDDEFSYQNRQIDKRYFSSESLPFTYVIVLVDRGLDILEKHLKSILPVRQYLYLALKVFTEPGYLVLPFLY